MDAGSSDDRPRPPSISGKRELDLFASKPPASWSEGLRPEPRASPIPAAYETQLRRRFALFLNSVFNFRF